MPGQAKYTVYVPKQDHKGQPLPNIAQAAHHYLHYGPVKVIQGYVDPDKQITRNRKTEPHDLLIAHAQDDPMVDSHIKQLMAYIGEVANRDTVHGSKENGKAINHWVVNNPMFDPTQ